MRFREKFLTTKASICNSLLLAVDQRFSMNLFHSFVFLVLVLFPPEQQKYDVVEECGENKYNQTRLSGKHYIFFQNLRSHLRLWFGRYSCSSMLW